MFNEISPIDVRKKIVHLKNGELTVHSWVPSQPNAIAVYIHGLQSHAAWSWELATEFIKLNTAFICMDRYCSGLSKGPHDEFPSLARITDDYIIFFNRLVELYPNLPIVAIGHCLGGSVLTAILAQEKSLLNKISAISIVSSWLGKMHESLSVEQIRDLESTDSDELWDIGLKAEDFSNSKDYQEFIKNDPLAIRKIKQRARKNILELEKAYINPSQLLINSKSQFITMYDDPVVDQAKAILQYKKCYGPTGSVHLLGGSEHYIPFTHYRSQFSRSVIQFLAESV